MSDKLGAFLNAACDWAERNDVPMDIWRSEVGEWFVTLRFKDSLGWFSMSLGYFDKKGANNGKPPETEDEYRDRIGLELSKTAQKARADRIKANNKLTKLRAKAA
jgi:hypothetical protein